MTLADDGAGTESRTVTWAYDKARQQAPQQRCGGERGRGERRQGRHSCVHGWRKELSTGLWRRGGLGVGEPEVAAMAIRVKKKTWLDFG